MRDGRGSRRTGAPREGRRRGAWGWALAVGLLLLGSLAACTPGTQRAHGDDEWGPDPSVHMIDGDLDAAETRWRKEIEADRARDDALLTDDPPGAPASYGKVAPAADTEEAAPPPEGFWGNVRAGAEKAGKVGIALASVLVTVGMLAAPYLLML